MESGFRPFGSAEDDYKKHLVGDPKSTILQIAISVVLGSSAFLAFCVSSRLSKEIGYTDVLD